MNIPHVVYCCHFGVNSFKYFFICIIHYMCNFEIRIWHVLFMIRLFMVGICGSLDVRPLVGQVVKQAGEWVRLLGGGLLSEARSRLNHVLEQVMVSPQVHSHTIQ